MNDFLEKLRPVAWNAWRIAIGFAFFTHGGQKLFAWFGRDTPVETLASMVGIAGILEFVGGAAIILGLRTRWVAFLLSGEMAVAYWYRHATNGGLWHWNNGGEVAMLFCFTFLLMSTIGGGDFSIDGLLKKNKST